MALSSLLNTKYNLDLRISTAKNGTTKVYALFAWLISHQPTVLFSQNKPATSNQPEPASSTLLSE
jgi:hypothetical protein